MGPLPPDVTPRMVFEALEWVMGPSDVVGVIIGEESSQDWVRRHDSEGAYAEVWFRTASIAEEASHRLLGQQLFRHWAWVMPLTFVVSVAGLRGRSPTPAARGSPRALLRRMGLGGYDSSDEELSGPAEEQAVRQGRGDLELEGGATGRDSGSGQPA